jgi:phosphoglycerate kinase
VKSPKRPVVAIIGGSKISSKLHVLESLLNQVDTLIIGGAMVYTFLKVKGIEVGRSRYEPSQCDVAAQFLSKIHSSTTRVLFPLDHCVVTDIQDPGSQQIVDMSETPENCMGVDIGPKTIAQINQALADAATILWNGPLGIFEIDAFATGTNAIATALANSNAVTIIGGGDSAAAIEKAGLTNRMTFISTGGGASLAYISNQSLPGIEVLVD